MSSLNSVGSPTSSPSSRDSYASSSSSLSSIVKTISSAFSGGPASLAESPTSALPSPQEKSYQHASDLTYLESEQRNESLSHQNPPQQLRTTAIPAAQNGPSALARLQDVQNVFCVAFGIFDRYYIAWEDTKGKQHQESNKLPPLLHDWLYPTSGQTRHLPSLQVSFGTNDEFFASDKDDKISSRDSIPPTSQYAPIPSLTKPRVRTNSQPTPNRDETNSDPVTISQTSRLRRRSTMVNLDYQPQSSTRATTERLETPGEISSHEPMVESSLTTHTINPDVDPRRPESEPRASSGLGRRQSLRVNLPRIRTSWSEQNTEVLHVPNREVYNAQRNYVDTCVQTDLQGYHIDEYFGTSLASPVLQYQPVQEMSFGLMQDYFRGQYSLGDALYYR